MGMDIKTQLHKRPLFIDDPFEKFVFRIDENNVPYAKQYTGDEFKTTWESNILHEALTSGVEITQKEYDSK